MRPYLLIALLGLVPLLHAEPSRDLPRSTPEAEGISSSALQSLYEDAGRQVSSFHSLMVVRHGRVVAEGWWAPYRASAPTCFSP